MILGNKYIGTIAYLGGQPALLEEFVWSWTQLILYNQQYLCEPGQEVYYWRPKVSFHAFARNDIVNNMKGNWLLQLDTDHKFEPDIAARMLYRMEKYSLDILTGIYLHKSKPHIPVIYKDSDNNKEFFEVIGDWEKPGGNYLVPITSAGAGCLMVRKQVFDRIHNELKEGPFDIIPPFGEDHSFFKRCAKLNIKAYCDPSIECNHLIVKSLSLEEDYDKSELEFKDKIIH